MTARKPFPDHGIAIVQHSAFGYNEDPTFEFAIETRLLTSAAERRKVIKAGGVVFDSHDVASQYEYEECFPGEREQLRTIVPHVPGVFSPERIDGLKIYIPKEMPGAACKE